MHVQLVRHSDDAPCFGTFMAYMLVRPKSHFLSNNTAKFYCVIGD